MFLIQSRYRLLYQYENCLYVTVYEVAYLVMLILPVQTEEFSQTAVVYLVADLSCPVLLAHGFFCDTAFSAACMDRNTGFHSSDKIIVADLYPHLWSCMPCLYTHRHVHQSLRMSQDRIQLQVPLPVCWNAGIHMY